MTARALPAVRESGRIPELTSIRAFAILAVLVVHSFANEFGTPNYGDSGDVDCGSRPVPASFRPAGWAILVAR